MYFTITTMIMNVAMNILNSLIFIHTSLIILLFNDLILKLYHKKYLNYWLNNLVLG